MAPEPLAAIPPAVVEQPRQQTLLADFERMIKMYKINKPLMRNKIMNFIDANNLTKDPKQMSEFMITYIDRVTQLQSFNLSELHMEILEYLTESQIASAKDIILMILATNFTYQNEVLWRNALKLIRKIISQVDYKGVRDILGHLLSQFPKLPNTGLALDNKRRTHLEELILFIISPEENLLPAYFVLDEVQKKKCIWKNASHSFRRKIEIFVDRFYNVAAMVSPNNRSPILFILSAAPNIWVKLEIDGKLRLKGHLPYNPSITTPQKELMLFLLEQNRCFESVISILKENVKERRLFLEECLVDLVLRAIGKFGQRETDLPLQEPSSYWDTRLEQFKANERVKKADSTQIMIEFYEFMKQTFHIRQAELLKFNFYDFVDKDSQLQQSRQFWQHITITFLCFQSDYCAHHLYFNDIIDAICTKAEKLLLKDSNANVFELSRDCFMLFLLQIVSRHKTPLSPNTILKLFRVIDAFHKLPSNVNNSGKKNQFDRQGSVQSMNGENSRHSSVNDGEEKMEVNGNGDMNGNSNANGNGNGEEEEDSINTVYSYAGAALFVHLSNHCKVDHSLNDLIAKVPEALVEKVNKILKYKDAPKRRHTPYFNVVLLHTHSTSNKVLFFDICKNFMETLNWSEQIPLDLMEVLPSQANASFLQHFVTTLKAYLTSRSGHTQNALILDKPVLTSFESLFRFFNRNSELLFRYDYLYVLKSFLTFFLSNTTRVQTTILSFVYTLLELISTRFSHLRPIVLQQFNSKPIASLTSHPQFHLGIEQATLKTVINFYSSDIIHQMQRPAAETLAILPQESVELNMLYMLSLSRAIRIHGFETLSNTFTDLFKTINDKITLKWSEAMFNNFPTFVKNYYQTGVIDDQVASKESLAFESKRAKFDEHFRSWKMSSPENEFSVLNNSSPFLYCMIFKNLLDFESWSSTVYKVLIQLKFQPQTEMLRTLADYLLTESVLYMNAEDSTKREKTISVLNDMIWKYRLFSLDRFVLYTCLRPVQSREAFCGLYIIHALLKNEVFSGHVKDYLSSTPSGHWSQCDQLKSNLEFLKRCPEKFYFEPDVDDLYSIPRDDTIPTIPVFPVYFDNVCLKLLSVLDVVIHRYIELPVNAETDGYMVQILEAYGDLYRYHDNPITYLYYTLHYYFDVLKGKESFKRQLVYSVVNAFRESRPKGWALSEQFLSYYHRHAGRDVFDEEYYCSIINRLYIALVTPSSSPLHEIDYRFNEFPNSGIHGVYSICIELLSLPEDPKTVGRELIKVYSGYMYRTEEQLSITTTALANLFITLPDCYTEILYDEIFKVFEAQKHAQSTFKSIPVFLQSLNHGKMFSSPYGRIMSLANAYLNNANYSKLFSFPVFIKDRLRPHIETEEQFIFVCYLIGPSLNRFSTERTRCVLDFTTELYDMLKIIDEKIDEFKYADTICDLLYHIKYQFTGDSVKDHIVPLINGLRPMLKEKLRYMVKIGESSV